MPHSDSAFQRRILELAHVLAEAEDHDHFLRLSMDFLTVSFLPDQILWADIDLGHERFFGLLDRAGEPDPEFSELLLRRGAEHPGIASYVVRPTDLSPRRLTDVVPEREWVESDIYREVFAPLGGRHQLSLVVSLRQNRGIGWTLFREDVDFTSRDLMRARMLLPVLTAFHQMFHRLTTPAESDPSTAPPAVPLTTREREVVRLLGAGLTAAAMARQLGIRPGTVRKHLEHIYGKFGAHDRVLVVNRARALGLLG